MDYSTDEYFIIRRLKMKLIELGYAEENLNTIIYSFYTHFNILITMSEIESININQTVLVGPYIFQNLYSSLINQQPTLDDINNDINYNNQYEEDEEDEDDMPPLVEANNDNYNIGNLFNIIIGQPTLGTNVVFNQIIIQPINNGNTNFMEDVLVTTDENTLNKLNVLKITNDMNEKCAICIEEMNEDEEYFDIKCKHIFHKECLETYLKNYNHICPVCRNDVGESFAHITS